MRIGVLGTGVVGQTLSGALAGLGHEVAIGTSDVDAALGLSLLLLVISFGLLVFFRRWLRQASSGASM